MHSSSHHRCSEARSLKTWKPTANSSCASTKTNSRGGFGCTKSWSKRRRTRSRTLRKSTNYSFSSWIRLIMSSCRTKATWLTKKRMKSWVSLTRRERSSYSLFRMHLLIPAISPSTKETYQSYKRSSSSSWKTWAKRSLRPLCALMTTTRLTGFWKKKRPRAKTRARTRIKSFLLTASPSG